MNTNNNTRRTLIIVAIIVIAATLLSACQSAPAVPQSLMGNNRIHSCDYSQRIQITSALNGDVNSGAADGMTIGQWLDSRMSQFNCISAEQ